MWFNLRVMMGDGHGPAEGSIEASLTVLAEMQTTRPGKTYWPEQRHTDAGCRGAQDCPKLSVCKTEYNIAHPC